MKLLTLSEKVNNSFNDTTRTAYKALVELRSYNIFLNLPLSLGMFVPCKDGKPLDKPKRTDYRDWDYQNDMDKLEEDYQEAEKQVLFKGFEITGRLSKIKEDYIISNDLINQIAICFNNGIWEANEWGLFDIEKPILLTISDLAEATKDNPLTINESN